MDEDTLNFTVNVNVRKMSGSKQSRDSIAQAVRDSIVEADPDEIDVGESVYEVTNWEVKELEVAHS